MRQEGSAPEYQLQWFLAANRLAVNDPCAGFYLCYPKHELITNILYDS